MFCARLPSTSVDAFALAARGRRWVTSTWLSLAAKMSLSMATSSWSSAAWSARASSSSSSRPPSSGALDAGVAQTEFSALAAPSIFSQWRAMVARRCLRLPADAGECLSGDAAAAPRPCAARKRSTTPASTSSAAIFDSTPSTVTPNLRIFR
jgi:hypothetical protein